MSFSISAVRPYLYCVHFVSKHSSPCERTETRQSLVHSPHYRSFLCVEIFTKTMAAYKIVLALTILIAVVNAQRPFYAGLSPIGYPAVEADLISNRFGEDEPYPIDARGDMNLINRLNQLPVDNQPFWYLNWRQYENFRRQPQTWPQRPNNFIGTR